MKNIFSKFTLSILLLSFVYCSKENEPFFVYDFQGIFLYSSPDLSSKVLKRIPFSSPVSILESREDGWIKLSYSGMKGFAYSPNINNSLPNLSLYVDSLDGIAIYEKPSEKSNVIDYVVHKTKLKIHEIHQEENKNKKLSWALIEGANLNGYARIDYLSVEPKSYFFSIVNSKGQPMRSKPGENSPILTNLPLNHIGEILEKSSELVTHSNTKGYWFRTEFKGKMGWIFSGYAVTSVDRKYLEDRDYIRNEEWFMRYMDSSTKVEPFYYNEKDLSHSKKDVFEQGNFLIYYIRYKHSADDCTVTNISRLIFKNKVTGQYFSIQGLYSQDLISLDKPFPNTIYTNYESCHCCCPDTGNLLYFILEDSVVYINYKAENHKASCLYGPIEGVELERENRFDPDNNIIFMNLKLPLCEPNQGHEVMEVKPIGFAHNLFAVLKKDKNNIIVNKFYDKGIPDSYRDAWENAIPNYELSEK